MNSYFKYTSFSLVITAVILGACNPTAKQDTTLPVEKDGVNLSLWKHSLDWNGTQVSVRAAAVNDSLLSYHFKTVTEGGKAAERQIDEFPQAPRLRTGNPLFDGLFALALEEVRENSVDSIHDGSFNQGDSIPCACFETGEKWHYVWTRDISYSVDLSLAYLDPERAKNSLLFKQSPLRKELLAEGVANRQVIAQDTGTGGSWPISTDRVVWLLGAAAVLDHLPAGQVEPFRQKVYRIAVDTVEQDRQYAFDAQLGLYRGETSFLDWREQTYPNWTREDTLFIAESFAFSTNVLHYIALRQVAELARHYQDKRADKFQTWAGELHRALNQRFWREQTGLYASYIGTGLHPVAAESYDLLGLALAVIHGVADSRQARAIMQRYPVTEAGPPVIWPQQQGVPIYHNRAIWPFVTAYGLQVAKQAGHSELISRYIESLTRGAATALSNMENFEFLTQQTAFEDGPLSGPVVNSRRQLWSVAGFLNMVFESVLGLEIEREQITVDPQLPAALAEKFFGAGSEITLSNFTLQGKVLNITLKLPQSLPVNSLLRVEKVYLNGELQADAAVAFDKLRVEGVNNIEVMVQPSAEKPAPFTLIAVENPKTLSEEEKRFLFAPREPVLSSVKRSGREVELTFAAAAESDTGFQIYRNGELLADGITASPWRDTLPNAQSTYCYSVTQRYRDSSLTSQNSPTQCVSLPSMSAVFSVENKKLMAQGESEISNAGGKPHYHHWGIAQQRLAFDFVPKTSGRHRLQVEYANAFGPINTGITASVKTVTMACKGTETNKADQSGVVVMPQLKSWDVWGVSSPYVFNAMEGDNCRVTIGDGFNMSYLEHFKLYTGGNGGREGVHNRANIAEIRVDFLN